MKHMDTTARVIALVALVLTAFGAVVLVKHNDRLMELEVRTFKAEEPYVLDPVLEDELKRGLYPEVEEEIERPSK